MLIVCLYTYVCIYHGKKNNSTGGGTLALMGRGGIWSKTTINVGLSKNRLTRGQKERDLICLQIMPKKILGMKEWQYTSILDCKNQLHTGQYTNGLMVRNF